MVIEDTVEGIQWLTNQTIHKTMFNKFDVIIGVSYIHFLKEFEKYNCKKIFWVHNTDYFPWWNGEEIPNHRELLNSPDLNKIVCLTNWHKKQWSNKYNLSLDKFKVIGNGTDANIFNKKIKKQLGKIIWSSAPERGLSELLNNWKNIKSAIPHAELHVFTPSYSIEQFNNIKSELKDVYFRGNVSLSKLHEEMLSSEYWFYLTSYEETYCITAIEMQLAGVFPIITNVAALNETVNSGIILEDTETKWEEAIRIFNKTNNSLRNRVIKNNIKNAKERTWLIRSLAWRTLIRDL
jgi:glycosyltransferase involved in cell wall biosynthesis